MIYTLVVVACVFSGVAMLAALHTLVRFDKIEKSLKSWSQSLSDDCNDALNARYQMILDAVEKDVIAYFDKVESSQDLSDVEQYIEENDIKIND